MTENYYICNKCGGKMFKSAVHYEYMCVNCGKLKDKKDKINPNPSPTGKDEKVGSGCTHRSLRGCGVRGYEPCEDNPNCI